MFKFITFGEGLRYLKIYLVYSKMKILQIHWHGRFGNRMFMYAFCNAFAKTYGIDYWIPSSWEGTNLFVSSKYCKQIPDDELRLHVNQSMKCFDTKEYRIQSVEEYKSKTGDNTLQYVHIQNKDIHNMKNIFFDDLDCMYFQHCFDLLNKPFLREIFEFSKSVKNSQIFKYFQKFKGTYDVVHLRRGDMANPNFNGAQSIISKKSYIDAIKQFGYEPNKMIWLSDNNEHCTPHFGSAFQKKAQQKRGHWHYPSGETQIKNYFFDFFPDFLILYFARTIFRGNSAFSWWAAELSDAKVYSPILHSKPLDKKLKFYEQQNVQFVEGNHPHFMGSKQESFNDINLPVS